MFKKLFTIARETMSNPWALLVLFIALFVNTSIIYAAMPAWINATWDEILLGSGSGIAAALAFWQGIIIAITITSFVMLLEVMVIGMAIGIVGAHFSSSRFIKPITTIAMGVGIYFIHRWWIEIITTSLVQAIQSNGWTPNTETINTILFIFTIGQAIACLFVGVPLDTLYMAVESRFAVKTSEEREDQAIRLIRAETQFQLTAVLNGQIPTQLIGSSLLGTMARSGVSLMEPSQHQLSDITQTFPGLAPVAKDLRFLPATNGKAPRWVISVDEAGYGEHSGSYVGLAPGETGAITPELKPFRPAAQPAASLTDRARPETATVRCPSCKSRVVVMRGVPKATCGTCRTTFSLTFR